MLGRKLARPVIFGLADGSLSIIGVVLYAAGHSDAVFPIALAGGVSAALSMSAGEWLSESSSGPSAAIAMGCATLGGSVLPAVPYLLLHGWQAPAVSVVLLAGVAAVVARLRAHRSHPYLETAAVLAVVLGASVACALLIPGGAG